MDVVVKGVSGSLSLSGCTSAHRNSAKAYPVFITVLTIRPRRLHRRKLPQRKREGIRTKRVPARTEFWTDVCPAVLSSEQVCVQLLDLTLYRRRTGRVTESNVKSEVKWAFSVMMGDQQVNNKSNSINTTVSNLHSLPHMLLNWGPTLQCTQNTSSKLMTQGKSKCDKPVSKLCTERALLAAA